MLERQTPSTRSRRRGHFTFDNFWLPQRARRLYGGKLPWQPAAECWLFFDGHRGMSDFTGTRQREVGNRGELGGGKGGRKGMSQAPQPGPPTKESMCNHYSSVSLFLSWADFFFPHTCQNRSSTDHTSASRLWLDNDGKGRGFIFGSPRSRQVPRRSEGGGHGRGERQKERIALRGEARTNEWAKKDKMEWSSIKRPAVISPSPLSPLPLMS